MSEDELVKTLAAAFTSDLTAMRQGMAKLTSDMDYVRRDMDAISTELKEANVRVLREQRSTVRAQVAELREDRKKLIGMIVAAVVAAGLSLIVGGRSLVG